MQTKGSGISRYKLIGGQRRRGVGEAAGAGSSIANPLVRNGKTGDMKTS